MLVRKKFLLSVSVMVCLALTLISCSSSGSKEKTVQSSDGQQANAKQKKVINISINEEPISIDPKFSGTLEERKIQVSIFDKLFDLDEKGNIVPMLVKTFELAADGKSYTFHLKQGIKFHDGTDFNAEAVKFNLERYKQDSSSRKSELALVKSVTVIDPFTVKIDLVDPFSPFLSILTDRSGLMASPEAVKKYGEEDFRNHPVGTGPYVYVERVRGDRITLKKNESYWNNEVKIDEINYKTFTNDTVAVQNLISGQLDIVCFVPFAQFGEIKNNPNLSFVSNPGYGYEGIHLNTLNEPFTNKYLRQAVNKAIDRDNIVKVIYGGSALPANSPFVPSQFAYGDSDKVDKPNPEEIKDLLKKGGKPDGFTFKLQILPIPSSEQLGTVIQGMLKQYNINMELEKVETATFLTSANREKFQSMHTSWSGRLDPDQNFYNFYVTNQVTNYSKMSNPKLDELAKQARNEYDPAKRKQLYDKAMEIVHDESGHILLVHKFNNFGLSKKIKGFTYISDGIIRTAALDKQ